MCRSPAGRERWPPTTGPLCHGREALAGHAGQGPCLPATTRTWLGNSQPRGQARWQHPGGSASLATVLLSPVIWFPVVPGGIRPACGPVSSKALGEEHGQAACLERAQPPLPSVAALGLTSAGPSSPGQSESRMPPRQSGGGDGPAWPGLRAGFSHSGQARQKGPANAALSLGSFHTRGHVGSREEPPCGAPRPGPLRRMGAVPFLQFCASRGGSSGGHWYLL